MSVEIRNQCACLHWSSEWRNAQEHARQCGMSLNHLHVWVRVQGPWAGNTMTYPRCGHLCWGSHRGRPRKQHWTLQHQPSSAGAGREHASCSTAPKIRHQWPSPRNFEGCRSRISICTQSARRRRGRILRWPVAQGPCSSRPNTGHASHLHLSGVRWVSQLCWRLSPSTSVTSSSHQLSPWCARGSKNCPLLGCARSRRTNGLGTTARCRVPRSPWRLRRPKTGTSFWWLVFCWTCHLLGISNGAATPSWKYPNWSPRVPWRCPMIARRQMIALSLEAAPDSARILWASK